MGKSRTLCRLQSLAPSAKLTFSWSLFKIINIYCPDLKFSTWATVPTTSFPFLRINQWSWHCIIMWWSNLVFPCHARRAFFAAIGARHWTSLHPWPGHLCLIKGNLIIGDHQSINVVDNWNMVIYISWWSVCMLSRFCLFCGENYFGRWQNYFGRPKAGYCLVMIMMMMVMIRTREDGKMVGIVLMIPANNGIYVSELGLDEHLCGGHW